MAKPKIDFKDFLLKRGEYLALGLAGFGLIVLFAWGVTRGAGAVNPEATAKDLDTQAKSVHNKIATAEGEPEPLKPWVTAPGRGYPNVPGADFVLVTLPFDPIAKPSAKRENPKVLGIRDYQVDLIRAPMKGYDIVFDTDAEGKEPVAKIAVRTTKAVGKLAEDRVKELAAGLRNRGGQGANQYGQRLRQQQQRQQPGAAAPPGAGAPIGGAGP
ncbi:MAG: hypothetical protein K2X87_31940, partial [Gemmataceae bacterium]|nr:hypothetical protein [Gemmataceae bacterium]